MSVPWDWKAVARQAFQEDDRPIILFDGDCNLCNGGVNFAIDHDPTGTTTALENIKLVSVGFSCNIIGLMLILVSLLGCLFEMFLCTII